MLNADFRAGDNHEQLKCDQYALEDIAMYNKPLYAASFTGTQSQISAARAMLNGRNRSSLSIDGSYITLEPKYDIKISKFPKYRMANMCIRSKSDALCLGDRHATVCSYIMGQCIDTPVLDEWMEWIVGKLVEERKVLSLTCYGGMEAYVCRFESRYLDRVVEQGLKFGSLKISA